MRRHGYVYAFRGAPDRRKRRAHQKTKRILWWGFACVGSVGGLAGAVFFLFFSTFFSIERIDVSASDGIDPRDVRSVLFREMDTQRFFFVRNGNIFLFDEVSARNTLSASFAVETLSFTRIFPSTLGVTITGKPFAALWCTQGACHTLYADGRAFQQADAIALGVDLAKLPEPFHASSTGALRQLKKNKLRTLKIPVFVDEKNEPLPQDNSPLVSQSVIRSANDFVESLVEKGIDIAYIQTYRQSPNTAAVTAEGWSILFTPFEDTAAQSENLQTVLQNKIKKKRNMLRSIDVRFQNHIYYTFQ